jgi:hypothetical protein
MEPDSSQSPPAVPHDAEVFGMMRNDAEPFRTVPQPSESFGTVPHGAESFRTISEEERAKYTLTVREAARVFERRGVARSERSITNWCTINKDGLSRLACHFDPNDRRYWITPESVERVIAEELTKAKVAAAQVSHADHADPPSQGAEEFGTLRNAADPVRTAAARESHAEEQHAIARRLTALEKENEDLKKENLDLKITNRGKDYFIEQLREDRHEMATERKDLLSRVMQWALGGPEKASLSLDVPNDLPPTAPPQQHVAHTAHPSRRPDPDRDEPAVAQDRAGEQPPIR